MKTDELKRLAEAEKIARRGLRPVFNHDYRAFVDAASPAVVLELIQQLEAANRDAERFAWYFGKEDKMADLGAYMYGMRAGWDVDQWRAAIDAAMQSKTL